MEGQDRIMPYADPAKKKQYMAAYNKKWYADNKGPRNLVGKAVNNKRNLRLQKKRWLMARLGSVCERCGTDEIEVLDVHHTAPSYKENRHKQITDYSWDALLTKAHTLQLLCSNCHRKHHAEERRSKA